MEPSAFALGASKEVSAVIALIRDLIRIDHAVLREVDKRAVRQLCVDLRVIYFEPTGVIGLIRKFLAEPPEDRMQLSWALNALRNRYCEEQGKVKESLERVSALKVRDNLEIDLKLFELAWRVGLGKGQSRAAVGSVLEYLFKDFDEYWNQVPEVTRRLQMVVDDVDRLNAEIAALDAELRKLQ